MNHHELITQHIKHLTDERGLSINALALQSGLTQSTLAGMFARPKAVPKLDTLYAIAAGIDMSLTELLDFPPYNQRPDGTRTAKERDKWQKLGDVLTLDEKERVRKALTDEGE